MDRKKARRIVEILEMIESNKRDIETFTALGLDIAEGKRHLDLSLDFWREVAPELPVDGDGDYNFSPQQSDQMVKAVKEHYENPTAEPLREYLNFAIKGNDTMSFLILDTVVKYKKQVIMDFELELEGLGVS